MLNHILLIVRFKVIKMQLLSIFFKRSSNWNKIVILNAYNTNQRYVYKPKRTPIGYDNNNN